MNYTGIERLIKKIENIEVFSNDLAENLAKVYDIISNENETDIFMEYYEASYKAGAKKICAGLKASHKKLCAVIDHAIKLSFLNSRSNQPTALELYKIRSTLDYMLHAKFSTHNEILPIIAARSIIKVSLI